MKEFVEIGGKLITHAKMFLRARKAKKVLLKDAVLHRDISSRTGKFYTKAGDKQRAAKDFNEMHPYDIKDIQGTKWGRIGQYSVRFDKYIPQCKASPCHTIQMVKLDGMDGIIVMYTNRLDRLNLNLHDVLIE